MKTKIFCDIARLDLIRKFNKKKIDQTKINKAINYSELNEFIYDLPKGMKTNIGNEGVKISGGQRQRILIARALFKNSRIIILDEGTNALDLKTELKILENLNNDKDLIKIIVSHRKESMQKCNKIFKLDENGLNEINRDFLQITNIFIKNVVQKVLIQ